MVKDLEDNRRRERWDDGWSSASRIAQECYPLILHSRQNKFKAGVSRIDQVEPTAVADLLHPKTVSKLNHDFYEFDWGHVADIVGMHAAVGLQKSLGKFSAPPKHAADAQIVRIMHGQLCQCDCLGLPGLCDGDEERNLQIPSLTSVHFADFA